MSERAVCAAKLMPLARDQRTHMGGSCWCGTCHHKWRGMLCHFCGLRCEHEFRDDDGVDYCKWCGIARCAT
jgi:hypothetical protein